MDGFATVQYLRTLEITQVHSFQDALTKLGAIVQETSREKPLRQHLIPTIPHILDQVCTVVSDEIEYLRLLRGLLLILRNLTVETPELDVSVVLKSLVSFKNTVNQKDIYEKVIMVYYQILSNVSEYNDMEFLSDTYSLLINEFELCNTYKDLKLPMNLLIANSFRNPNNIYEVLHWNRNEIVEYLVNQFNVSNLDQLDDYHLVLVTALQRLISHESFNNWIKTQDLFGPELQKLLKVCQLIICSKDNWDNYQLIAILSWCVPLFDKVFDHVMELFNSKQLDKIKDLHHVLLIVLDCISELSKFNITKDFLINYKMINKLIPLLRVIHENIAPKNMMKSSSPSSIEFPHIKSIIIEIIAYLTHENFEIQESIRELHGLEVILSNCIIDDNNPFIKERAIICLKYLLYKNSSNQAFVASLEARKLIDDTLLQEINGEIKFKNGDLQLE